MNRTTLLIWLAALSFIPTLWFYLVGEEGSYSIIAMEMWHSHDWLIQTIYGNNLQRPPLFTWLTIPVATLIGWTHIVIAIRLVTVAATLGMAALLYWLTRKLFDDKAFALFAALTCLSLADLLLYRGWLSYTDPLFGFFIFGAISTLWAGCEKQRKTWLALSILLIGCALLTKAVTAYIFYATALFVLFLQPAHRRFLLSPASLVILFSSLIVPYIWFSSLPQVGGQGGSMMGEIARKFSEFDVAAYLQRLVLYPLDKLLWLSPAPLLALYFIAKNRVQQTEPRPNHFRAALLIAGLSVLPYWLAPQGGIRYLVPVYPLIALISARLIWRSGVAGQQLALRWFTGLIAFKFAFVLAFFPYYQTHYRGENYQKAAYTVIKRTEGFPLYVTDVSATGLSVAGYIDQTRLPLAPLIFPPEHFVSGYVLSRDDSKEIGQVVETYNLAADHLFLLCRGAACKK